MNERALARISKANARRFRKPDRTVLVFRDEEHELKPIPTSSMRYTVDCTAGIWSGKEFTSRRKAEEYIARLRRVYPQLVRDRRKFTIRRISGEAHA